MKFYTVTAPCLVLTFVFGYLFLYENGRKWETAFGACNLLMVRFISSNGKYNSNAGTVSRESLYPYHIWYKFSRYVCIVRLVIWQMQQCFDVLQLSHKLGTGKSGRYDLPAITPSVSVGLACRHCLPACLPARPSVRLSVCLSVVTISSLLSIVCLSRCLSILSLSVRLSVCPSVCPSVCLAGRLSVCLSVLIGQTMCFVTTIVVLLFLYFS